MTYRCRAPAWKATIALLHTRPFLAATHFREHKTRETLCRTQEYEVHEALDERHPNADLLEASMVVKSVEFYMISIQSPLTWY